MGYQLGIDLGTTYTAAAVFRDGDARIFPLGGRSASMPSVVHLREDETVLTGEAANRRAITEPDRVAREFKRRLGDTAPIIVGGSPYSAEALMARVLKYAIAEVAKREGGQATRIAVCHPANWGEYKIDLLRQAVRLAGLDPRETVLLTEPEAAAIYYASQKRVEPGEIVAVYDLGGGTFDTAVLRRTATGFEILGRPEGIERLGGVDFDAAVFAHVARSIGSALEDLDTEDPMSVSAVARLRQDCVDAKEALSSDTDAAISVMLPNFQTEVRITRSEFEALIRPALSDSIDAMKRALDSAGVEPKDVSSVLLVGGSSRIPLISQMVSSGLGRPVSVDTHPKHAIAMGAAVAASDQVVDAAAAASTAAASTAAVAETPPTPSAAVATAAAASAIPQSEWAAPVAPKPSSPEAPKPQAAAASTTAAASAEAPRSAPPKSPEPATASAPARAVPPRASPRSEPAPAASKAAPTGSNAADGGSKLPLMVGAGVGALALVVGGFFGIKALGGDDANAATSTTVASETTEPTSTTSEPDETTTTTAPPAVKLSAVNALVAALDPVQNEVDVGVDDNKVTLDGRVIDETTQSELVAAVEGLDEAPLVVDNLEVVPEDERCTELIRSQPHWVCLDGATIDADGGILVDYTSEFGDDPFSVGGGFHLHVFSGDIDPATAGAAGAASIGGSPWLVWDVPELVTATSGQIYNGETPEKLCARIANPSHQLESLDSGQCVPLVQE